MSLQASFRAWAFGPARNDEVQSHYLLIFTPIAATTFLYFS
jgi:hypothetical protein